MEGKVSVYIEKKIENFVYLGTEFLKSPFEFTKITYQHEERIALCPAAVTLLKDAALSLFVLPFQM